jgi:hypothetical protein
MINPVNTPALASRRRVVGVPEPELDKPGIKSVAPSQVPGKSDTSSLSTLARQLAESAVRAQAREKEMSRGQLHAYGMRMEDQIFGPSGSETKARYAAEVPKTDDPELLERARQATLYVTRTLHGDYSVKNPFTELTREQAALIAYDDAGPYTRHEREAAYWHGSDLEQQWRVGLFARSEEESRQFGTRVGFYTEILTHLKGLPTIEHVKYGGLEYEARLGQMIAEEMEGLEPTDRLLTLFEVLARMRFPELKEKYEKQPAGDAAQAARKAMNAPSATAKEAAPTKSAAENPTPAAESTTINTSSLSADFYPGLVAAECS